MVNESIAYARLGNNKQAEDSLRKALKVAPENAAANFNLGLLKAEENDFKGAEVHLRTALETDPQMAQAAYNLCLILSKDHLEEALGYCSQAAQWSRDVPRYAYSLAFLMEKQGNRSGAARVLEDLISRHPSYADSYMLLGAIYEREQDKGKAMDVYEKGLFTDDISEIYKLRMKARLDAVKLSILNPRQQ
jgi:Flp pilus assembly protein TadD